MEKLSGWKREVIGKMLVGEIFGSLCRLKGADATTKFMIMLHQAIGGQEMDKLQVLNCSKLLRQRQQERTSNVWMKELAYLCREIKNPLNGIRFTNSLLEATDLTENQKQFLETRAACERQMSKIIRDVDLDNIEDGSLELKKREFCLACVMDVVVSQVMLLLRERGMQLIRDIPEEIKTLRVYGDQVRIQQVFADFLQTMASYAPSQEGWVEVPLQPSMKQISDGVTIVHIEFRIVCPGEGLPPAIVQDMFHNSQWVTQESLGLSMSRRKPRAKHVQKKA
ncbi:Phytochrome B [Capsicum baccatum]|uniref:histidine kinase n=1 Tax=Capsicum baccatum TaxID=33114 RepID=A0A2G2WTW9_CAPBA|nr:Phytochrome B [Capsicum baccatum]